MLPTMTLRDELSHMQLDEFQFTDFNHNNIDLQEDNMNKS